MPPAAETAERIDGELGLLGSHRYNLWVGHAKEAVQAFASGFGFSALDDRGGFDPDDGRDEPDLRMFEQLRKPRTLGFVEQNSDNGRGVDHHRHMPFSS